VATARARSVLPVPGGPYRRHPFGGVMPTRLNNSGLINGNSTTYSKSVDARIRTSQPHLTQLTHLFGQSTNAGVRDIAGILVAHFVHQWIDLARQMAVKTCQMKSVCAQNKHAYRMIVRVVMSSDTRVPCFSSFLSMLRRQPTTYRGPFVAFTMTA